MSLVALLLAWVYIFDTVQRERELLEGPKDGIVGAAGLQDPSQVAHTTTVFPPDRADSSKEKDGEEGEASGENVSIPPQMLVDAADGRSIGDLYAPMSGTDRCTAVQSYATTAFTGCTICCIAAQWCAIQDRQAFEVRLQLVYTACTRDLCAVLCTCMSQPLTRLNCQIPLNSLLLILKIVSTY